LKQCDRYLWLSVNQNIANKIGIYPDPEPTLATRFELGNLFETKEILSILNSVDMDEWVIKYKYYNNSFLKLDWDYVKHYLSNHSKVILVQPQFQIPNIFVKSLNLDVNSINSYFIPDLVEIDSINKTVKIIDIKLSDTSKLTHRLQVSFYFLLLKNNDLFSENWKFQTYIFLKKSIYPGELFEIEPYITYLNDAIFPKLQR